MMDLVVAAVLITVKTFVYQSAPWTLMWWMRTSAVALVSELACCAHGSVLFSKKSLYQRVSTA